MSFLIKNVQCENRNWMNTRSFFFAIFLIDNAHDRLSIIFVLFFHVYFSEIWITSRLDEFFEIHRNSISSGYLVHRDHVRDEHFSLSRLIERNTWTKRSMKASIIDDRRFLIEIIFNFFFQSKNVCFFTDENRSQERSSKGWMS